MSLSLLDALAFAVLIPAVVLHEVSHGVVALAFGDDTARQAGRVTLNPVPHIDPFGTVLLPLLLAVVGAPLFGWARPVPVNPARMRRPRDHGLITSLAGPATNIVLAVAAGLALRGVSPRADQAAWLDALFFFGAINVVLAAFNLIPLPPLDGGHLAVLATEESVNAVRRWRGRPGTWRLHPSVLMPLAFAVILLFVVLSLTALYVDIVKPASGLLQ